MGLENNRHLSAIGVFDDDGIERRVEAVKKISARIRRRTAFSELLPTANQMLQALSSSALDPEELPHLLKIMEKAVPSFVYDDGKAKELSLLLVLGFADAIDVSHGASSENMGSLATAAYSGLEYLAPFDEPALDDLRKDLLALCSRKATATEIRKREDIPQIDSENALDIIGRLARNAARDREEIDLLWWITNNWSQLADTRLSDADPEVAAVLSALETSALMVGPGQRAHREIATRHVRDATAIRSPAEFAGATMAARGWARHALQASAKTIQANQANLPALAIVVMDEEQADLPADAATGHSYSVLDWCRRLVDEIGLLRRLGQAVRVTRAA